MVNTAPHPVGTGRRSWSLNPDWLFAGPILTPGDAPRYRGRFERVNLPHTVTTLSWRDWDPASWEGFWLYRKEFDLGEDPGDARRYLLRFEGAMTSTRPWLNGTQLAEHVGGYLPFEYEVTGMVRGEGNRLDVVVDGRWEINAPPNRPAEPNTSIDLWQPAGLYRGVSLCRVPPNHLADVFARPRDVLDPRARSLDVQATVDVTVPDPQARLEIELWDADTLVAGRSAAFALEGTGRIDRTVTVPGLSDVELWSPASPKLYRLVVRLHGADHEADTYRTKVGFRRAEFTSRGFLLNGERLQLIGSGRHHYYPFTGSAMPPRVQRRDVEILKHHGHNMVRCTVYPQDVSFLDACDELGLLVYDEAPGWGHLGDEQWRERSLRDIREMIIRDRNHPSIVLWGARLNETPDNAAFYERAQQVARELDDSRATTGAMIFFRYDSEYQQDVFSYNDYARDGAYPRLYPPRRDRPYLVSEAVGALAGPARFYRRTDPVTDQHGQAVAHAMVHDQGRADPAYCGVLGWAAYDYQSANGNQQHGVKSPGVFDMFREPKPGAAAYSAQVEPADRIVIEPAFYWDFQGRFSVHELGAAALIFSNAERLELFVGGDPFGTLYPDRERFPNLPYPPFAADFRSVDATAAPELRIDAYRGGVRVGSRRFAADPGHDRLEVTVDDEELTADGSDATRVALRVVDEFGAVRPGHTGEVTIDVTGPATLLGDNPFPLGETGGVGAVWLRSRYRENGEVALRATHETLGAGEVQVRVTRSG